MTAIALAVVLAAPVPKGDEKLPPPTPEQYRTALNNLKQMGLAVHNYHDTYGHLPGNVVDAKGKALLSWRVNLLPFLEEDAVFKQFKMDEAWDSEANKKLIEKLPKVYAPVRAKAKPGETYLRAFEGPGSLFEAGKKLRFPAVTDGTSNTGMVFEAKDATVWTRPDDILFDPAKPTAKLLGGQFDGECHVLLGDGSAFLMKKDPDEATLRNLIQRDDDMVIEVRSLYATNEKRK